tara:strand:- start:829 stop:1614 length:786 start_codon:yes stop_codon:yes gene_type:complete
MYTPMEQKQLRKEYKDNGYLVFKNVLDAGLLQETSNHVDWLMGKNPDLRPENLGHSLMTNDPFWVRLVGDNRLLDIAEIFVGKNIALFASHYISKPSADGRPVLWHQDGSYWPLEPMEVITLWLAVDESTIENGCMRVISGTHHSQLQEMKKRQDIPNVLSSGIDPNLVDETKAVDVILEAGDVSVHHPNIIHGSNPNLSTKRRCGLTIRYIPSSTRIVSDQQWPSAFMLRGMPVDGVNNYLPKPKYTKGKHMTFNGCESW